MDCFHQHHYAVPHPPQRRLIAPTVQFSAGIVILCGVRREPPTSAGSDPATGGRWRCRTPRLSPRTVFKTGSETARNHLPCSLEVLHHARSGVEPDRLGTRTPLHLQGYPLPYVARNWRSSPRYGDFSRAIPFVQLLLLAQQPQTTVRGF